ncbi:putative protein phosphatase 2C 13 [Camellia lanceoleosa]|uniref:Uncharacterized protein n=1 Tax=Camellia lanceoleosa TaxID=1840588 RepID=A0ACC0HS41_9ERIC|nr:putative protein phosphatase 2C 13 [Camellia lanceoleosa]
MEVPLSYVTEIVLPADECRYAVYDYDFVTEENCQKSRIFFIAWSPDTSRVRSKMIYASSKDRFKRELDGIHFSDSSSSPTTVMVMKFALKVRSGSHTATGLRRWNEDEHIVVDDLSSHLGSLHTCPLPTSFYAVFDGHGGSEAATYLKNNAIRFLFQDVDFFKTSHNIDDGGDDNGFLNELKDCHIKAFLLADRALADEECSGVSSDCGTTALTALVLGRHLVVANAGDCRAVICRKGIAVPITQDHRTSYLPERRRVEELGGTIKFRYPNGELAVTRALGDWYMKSPFGSVSLSPLTAEPDVHQIVLTEDDEFLIMASDGIWDVLSNQEAVDIVCHGLMQRHHPQQCASEVVDQALGLGSKDNLTAIVVCFTWDVDRKRPRRGCKRKAAFV